MKQLTIFFIITILTILNSCSNIDEKKNNSSSPSTAVDNLLNKIELSLKNKYKMKPIATNVSMPGGNVKLLGLDFQLIGPHSQEEIRELLLNAAHEFITFVNLDDDIKPFLEVFPFTIENLEITLFFKDRDGRGLNDPEIGIAGITRGELDYETIVRNDFPSIEERTFESYAEALRKVQDFKKNKHSE